MRTIECIDRILARLEGWFIIGLLWTMVLLTFIQVVLRSLYTHGHFLWANEMLGRMDWSGPLVQLLVLWLTFLGSSLLTKSGNHIGIDLLRTILPARWLPLRELILAMIALFILGVMVKVCTEHVVMEMEFGGDSLYHLPSWIGQTILPLGFALLFFRFLIKAVHGGTALFRGSDQ